MIAYATTASAIGLQPNNNAMVGSACIMLCGLVAASVVGGVAMLVATVRGIRVFLLPSIVDQCQGDFGRLREIAATHLGFNHVIYIVSTSIVMLFMIPAGVICAAFGLLKQDMGKMNDAGLYLLFGIVILGIAFYIFCSWRFIASNAKECWCIEKPIKSSVPAGAAFDPLVN